MAALIHSILLAGALLLGARAHAQPAPAASAEVSVLVSNGSSVQTLSRSQAIALFTGRLRALPNGEQVQPLDMPLQSPARETFYRLLTGMSLAQINSYWARLVFSGQIQPPLVVESEAAMAKTLRENPRSIGYVVRLPDDNRLRVVLTLKPET